MVSLEQQERIVFLNSQYQDNSELIHRLQDKLLQDIDSFDLSIKDLKDTQEFIQDKVTIFRFLRQVQFDFDKAHEQLLKTIGWRIELGISDLTFKSCIEFFFNEKNDGGAFSFFHKSDLSNSPLLFVRLRYFPNEFRDPTKKLIHHIQRYACLIMEMARKLMWQTTCDQGSLVSQMTVVVNIQNAPMIPINAEIIKMIGVILEDRFPDMVGTVNILNFGWMYQGIWSVVKYLLSEEAKNSIRFTSVSELKPLISSDSILQEMGGDDDYLWTFESDQVLQKYGSGRPIPSPTKELPTTPPRSRPSSIISSGEEDEFFDANDTLPSIPITPPHEIIPHPIVTTTSLTSPTSLPGTLNHNTKSYYGNLSSWVGLRMGVEFLTSFIDTKQGDRHQRQKKMDVVAVFQRPEDESELLLPPPSEDSIIIVNSTTTGGSSSSSSISVSDVVIQQQEEDPNSLIFMAGYNLKRMEIYIKNLTKRILQLSVGQRGILYWALLYLFLRGPVESLVRQTLVRTVTASSFIVGPKRITSTTIGITAAVAAVVSSSLSNSSSIIEKFRRREKK